MLETTYSMLMKAKGLNPNSLSKLINISQQATRLIVNGESIPRADVLTSLLVAFPDLNANWLLTGHGSMFTNQFDTKLQPTTAKEPATVYKNSTVMDLTEKLEWANNALKDKELIIKLYAERIKDLEARLSVYEGNGGEKKSAGL